MELRLRSSGLIGGKTEYHLYSQSWTAKDCGRVIQFLRLTRDWIEQDNYAACIRDQWRGMSAG